jgi:hypothetical protein
MVKDIKDFDYSEEFMEKVMQQQEAIRLSGELNMFNMRGVRDFAEQAGHDELKYFIKNSTPDEYMEMANASREFAIE